MNPIKPSLVLHRVSVWVRHIAQEHYYAAVILLMAFIVLITGLGVIPREPYLLTAQNPFDKVPIHEQNYFQASPLLPLFAHTLGLTTPLLFRGTTFALFLIACVVVAWGLRKRMGAYRGLLLYALTMAHPVTVVLLSWLGTPDSLTFLFSGLTLFVTSPLVLFFIAALGMFNHPLAALGPPGILLLRMFSKNEEIQAKHLISYFSGLVAGWLAAQGFVAYHQIEIFSRIEFLFTRSLATWTKMNFAQFPLAVFSFHGAGWLALVACWLAVWKLDRRYSICVIGLLMGYFGITFFSADTTRVFTLLAWGIVVHCVLHSWQLTSRHGLGELRRELEKATLLSAVIGLFAPRYYVWTGELHGAPFADFYRDLLRAIRSLG